MSTAVRVETPVLVEGDHLDQEEFHRRYEAMPPGVKAELIDGVVYMPSPVSYNHGGDNFLTALWLGLYAIETPGIQGLDNTTTVLGPRSEPQPDVSMRILPEFGGQTVNDGEFIGGAPEFVVEVARSSRYVDLGPKLAVYEQAGVQEYVVRAFRPDELIWFRRVDAAFVRVSPDADGLYRSTAFPGLWLDPSALLQNDLRRIRQVVEQGTAAPEHAAFVARLAANRASTT
jgi:Uma2 family endonuclease